MEDGAVCLGAVVAMQANPPRCFIQCGALDLRRKLGVCQNISPFTPYNSQSMYHAMGSGREVFTL